MNEASGLLARMGIDAEALLNHLGQDRHSQNTQRRLIDALREYCLLELTGPSDAEALLDAIGELSPTLRERWTSTLAALHGHNRVRVGDAPQAIGDIVRAHPMPQELRQTLDLIVLGQDAAAEQGVPEQSGCQQRPGEPEVSVADSVDLCRTISAIRAMHKSGNFPEGTPRDDIWDRVFAPLAVLSDEATILDRFFLTYYLRTENYGKDRRIGHVEWFIRSLDRTLLPGSTARILGEWPATLSENQVRDLLDERLAPLVGSGHIARIQIVLAAAWERRESGRRAPGSKYGAHNRHLRFSCGMAVKTEEGFDRFKDSRIKGVDGFTWTLVSSPDRLKDLGRGEATVTQQQTRVAVELPGPRTVKSPTAVVRADGEMTRRAGPALTDGDAH